MKRVSFVVPVYNEEAGIRRFVEEMLLPEIKSLGLRYYEILLVNDGSRDRSLEILHALAKTNENLRVISFVRNFGKEVALTAGLAKANGDAIIMCDADGEHPTEIIGEMLARWNKGALMVSLVRKDYEHHRLLAKVGSKLFYGTLKMLGVKSLKPGSTDFRLLDRVVVDEFNRLGEHERMTRGLLDWMGFPGEAIYANTGKRIGGKPSYSFRKLTKLAVGSFVSLSTTPLLIFGWVGVAIMLLSGVLGLFVTIEMWILSDPLGMNITGSGALAIMIMFLVGLILVSQAITALYISRIYIECQGRPLYIIDWKNSKGADDAA